MITVADVRGRLTLTVPEMGQLLGLGRDTTYEAVERGELPAVKVGRRIVCPTHAVLQLLGLPDDLIARAIGLEPDSTNGTSATEMPLATIHVLAKEQVSPHDAPRPA